MKVLRWVFSASFLFTALYHLYAIIQSDGDIGRHWVFVGINLVAFIIFYLDRPKLLMLFVPLIGQQLYSHGAFGWTEWRDYQRIDWPSVFVLLGMPVLAFYIFKKNKQTPR